MVFDQIGLNCSPVGATGAEPFRTGRFGLSRMRTGRGLGGGAGIAARPLLWLGHGWADFVSAPFGDADSCGFAFFVDGWLGAAGGAV